MTKKILVIEDNESYSTLLIQNLSRKEFEVIAANDGFEGLEKASQIIPDLLLIDLLLPRMNGIQLIEEIRKRDWGKMLPLIILTNLNPDPELLKNIEKNKPADYLIKPQATMEFILEKVRNTLATNSLN